MTVNKRIFICNGFFCIQIDLKAWTGLLFCALACFCTLPTRPHSKISRDSAHPGMVRILATGKKFIQGDNESSATADEKPTMTAQFTYDYYLDTTDVTQKEFFIVTGKSPVSSGSKYGIGDAYPVYDVSWYDAVLFCNAKSKLDSLDTVYSYSFLSGVSIDGKRI